MELLRKKGATKYQKVIAAIFTINIIGLVGRIFTHHFVTEPHFSRVAVYISLLLTLILITAVGFLYIRGAWRPTPVWYKYSAFKKIVLVPFIPIFIFVLFWVNIAISLPYLFTAVFGQTAIKNDVVIKDHSHSRRSCDYRLKPNSINVIFFRYCISEGLYNRLPGGEIEAELILKKSMFGYIVKNIRIKGEVR